MPDDFTICFTKNIAEEDTTGCRAIEKESRSFEKIHYDSSLELNGFNVISIRLTEERKAKGCKRLLTGLNFEKTWGDAVWTKSLIRIKGFEDRNNLITRYVIGHRGR